MGPDGVQEGARAGRTDRVLAVVDVFDLDRTLVADYASFARSFTQIRAQDIRDKVDEIYANRRFWPEPLITAFRAGFIRRNAGSKWVAPS
jgi:hypothetical protein